MFWKLESPKHQTYLGVNPKALATSFDLPDGSMSRLFVVQQTHLTADVRWRFIWYARNNSVDEEALMNSRINILIIDDHTAVRQGLSALINTVPGMVVVGEVSDGETAVQVVRDLRPDVIVMDLTLPDMSGIKIIEAIHQASPQTRTLVLTSFGEDWCVLAALRAGVQGYLLKDAISTDVIDAIQDVYIGKLTLHPSLTHILIQAIQEPQ